jgi:hypothetical protein
MKHTSKFEITYAAAAKLALVDGKAKLMLRFDLRQPFSSPD